jgi:hypothetical protein
MKRQKRDSCRQGRMAAVIREEPHTTEYIAFDSDKHYAPVERELEH